MFDRQLVASAVRRHLTALKWPLRPVIFHPSLRAATDQFDKLTLLYVHDSNWYWGAAEAAQAVFLDATWDAWDVAWSAVREAGRAARAAREVAWSGPKASVSSAAAVGFRTAALFDARVTWAVMMGITCDTWYARKARQVSLQSSSGPTADYSFSEAARTFLEVLRGGAFFLWTAPEAVHVVLATIRTQERRHRHLSSRGSRLHCDDGPAIQYEDGSGICFWRGIQVPERMILCPGEMRVEEILQERNVEVRRAMIERYGQDRFFLNANAQPIDKWKDNELLSIDLPDDPDGRMVALKLRCPSTAAVYIIRVPPNQRTVQGALAWSFGLGPEEYILQEES